MDMSIDEKLVKTRNYDNDENYPLNVTNESGFIQFWVTVKFTVQYISPPFLSTNRHHILLILRELTVNKKTFK